MSLDWQSVDWALFDMDGTLLDLHFDNYFWAEYLPRRYAEHHGLPVREATEQLLAQIESHRGTLAWYCLEHWSEITGLDIIALKREVQHKVQIRPHTLAALAYAKGAGKRLVLATNAHRSGLEFKLELTGLAHWFEYKVSSHDYGHPKESVAFWEAMVAQLELDPARAVLFDDNLDVLRAANAYGIGQVVQIRRPDLTRPPAPGSEFAAVLDFDELLPEDPA